MEEVVAVLPYRSIEMLMKPDAGPSIANLVEGFDQSGFGRNILTFMRYRRFGKTLHLSVFRPEPCAIWLLKLPVRLYNRPLSQRESIT